MAAKEVLYTRVPVELYERVRKEAYNTRRTQQDIVETAIKEYLEKLDEIRALQDATSA